MLSIPPFLPNCSLPGSISWGVILFVLVVGDYDYDVFCYYETSMTKYPSPHPLIPAGIILTSGNRVCFAFDWHSGVFYKHSVDA